MTTPNCQDCKHCIRVIDNRRKLSWADAPFKCGHPEFIFSSEPWQPDCHRKKGQACGPTAKLFDVKPEPIK